MGRLGKLFLVISTFVLSAIATTAQVTQKPFPGQDLNNVWTASNDFTSATGLKLPSSIGFAASPSIHLGIDTSNDNCSFYNGNVSLICLGITSGSTTNGHVPLLNKSGGSVTVADSGSATGGNSLGGSNAFAIFLPGLNTGGDYMGWNSSGTLTELTPGLVPVPISANGTTVLLSSYRGEYVKATATTGGAQTFALPDATNAGFGNDFYFQLCDHSTIGALSVTNNGGSFTFNGAASPFSLPEGYCAAVSTNSANNGWVMDLSPGLLTGGTGINIVAGQFGQTLSVSAAPLSSLATQAADTVVMNATGSSAVPTAVVMPTCAASGHADVYDPSSHTWTCNSISSGAPSLDQVTASAANQTIANANFDETWTYSLTTASTYAFSVKESAASTATGNSGLVFLGIDTGSTLNPLTVETGIGGTLRGFFVNSSGNIQAVSTGNSSLGDTNHFNVIEGASLIATTTMQSVSYQGSGARTNNLTVSPLIGDSGSGNNGSGNLSIIGVDETGTGSTKSGSEFIFPGAVTSTSGIDGQQWIGTNGFVGTIAATYDVVTIGSSSYTFTDTAATATNWTCIAVTTTNPVRCVYTGVVPVKLSNTAVVGHYVCTSSTGGQGADSSTACPAFGEQIGIVIDISGTANTPNGAVTATTSIPFVLLSRS